MEITTKVTSIVTISTIFRLILVTYDQISGRPVRVVPREIYLVFIEVLR